MGDGSTTNRSEPVQIGTGVYWKSIEAGFNFNVALNTSNTLWVWGSNEYGQLGDGTIVNKNVPTQMGSATN